MLLTANHDTIKPRLQRAISPWKKQSMVMPIANLIIMNYTNFEVRPMHVYQWACPGTETCLATLTAGARGPGHPFRG